jgi:hypothetical protein
MRDLAIKPILWSGVAIAATVLVVVVSVFALLRFDRTAPGGERLRFGYAEQLDAPGLASAPQVDFALERRKKEERLQSSGWVDQPAGIAHIPIADAMDLLAARSQQRSGSKQP